MNSLPAFLYNGIVDNLPFLETLRLRSVCRRFDERLRPKLDRMEFDEVDLYFQLRNRNIANPDFGEFVRSVLTHYGAGLESLKIVDVYRRCEDDDDEQSPDTTGDADGSAGTEGTSGSKKMKLKVEKLVDVIGNCCPNLVILEWHHVDPFSARTPEVPLEMLQTKLTKLKVLRAKLALPEPYEEPYPAEEPTVVQIQALEELSTVLFDIYATWWGVGEGPMPAVREIAFDCDMDSEAFDAVARFPNATSLRFCETIPPSKIDCLPTRVKKLDLSEMDAHMLPFLGKCSELTEFSVNYFMRGGCATNCFSFLQHLFSLQSLKVVGRSTFDAKELSNLSASVPLRCLGLDGFAKNLAPMLDLVATRGYKLESLSLLQVNCSDDATAALRLIEKCSGSLRQLKLDGWSVDDSVFRSIDDKLAESLTHLDLTQMTKVTAAGVLGFLEQRKRLANLKESLRVSVDQPALPHLCLVIDQKLQDVLKIEENTLFLQALVFAVYVESDPYRHGWSNTDKQEDGSDFPRRPRLMPSIENIRLGPQVYAHMPDPPIPFGPNGGQNGGPAMFDDGADDGDGDVDNDPERNSFTGAFCFSKYHN